MIRRRIIAGSLTFASAQRTTPSSRCASRTGSACRSPPLPGRSSTSCTTRQLTNERSLITGVTPTERPASELPVPRTTTRSSPTRNGRRRPGQETRWLARSEVSVVRPERCARPTSRRNRRRRPDGPRRRQACHRCDGTGTAGSTRRRLAFSRTASQMADRAPSCAAPPWTRSSNTRLADGRAMIGNLQR